jgi:hypothetical protein
VYERLLSAAEPTPTWAGQSLLPPLPAKTQPVPLSNLGKTIHQLGNAESPVEAIFGPAPILQEAIKSGLPVKLTAPVGVQPLAVAVVTPNNLKTKRLLAEINQVLNRLQRAGTLSEIYLRWYQQDFSQKP